MYGMKMTMHIDEPLLKDVMDAYNFSSKTDAVDSALREMIRRFKIRQFAKKGLGFSADELRASVDADYDPMALRVAEDSPGHA
jgi:Arc/MetJ family transcription regulator